MTEPDVARCSTCGTRYTARAWPWLQALSRDGDVRTCAVPGCAFPVERATATALRLAADERSGAANHAPTVIDTVPKRSESPMKPKKTAKKPAPEPEAPAILSIRGHTPDDYAAFERARARLSQKVGGAFVSLSQAVLVLARLQAAREDAEERAQAEAARAATRDELVHRLIEARRAVEASMREGWMGTNADRVALVAAQEEAFVALARDAGMAT